MGWLFLALLAGRTYGPLSEGEIMSSERKCMNCWMEDDLLKLGPVSNHLLWFLLPFWAGLVMTPIRHPEGFADPPAVLMWGVMVILALHVSNEFLWRNVVGTCFFLFKDKDGCIHRHRHDPLPPERATVDGCYVVGRDADDNGILMPKSNIVLRICLGGWWQRSKVFHNERDWHVVESWKGVVKLHIGAVNWFPLTLSIFEKDEYLLPALRIIGSDISLGTIVNQGFAFQELVVFLDKAIEESRVGLGQSQHARLIRDFLLNIKEQVNYQHKPALPLIMRDIWDQMLFERQSSQQQRHQPDRSVSIAD